ncbi:MAG TPA: Rieske 2Fe-2S domain-containing protein [Candidatus Thermoplasmatota archaeon]|nr:Rieske 2Fe-2S domain-containing protein [Candidatus Thermoplasmatota archaeon]
MEWVDAAALEELPDGRPVERWLGDHLVLLLRTGRAVAATQGHCPHKFTSLADGAVADGRLTCPLHAACFDLATGEPLPGQEWAGRLQVHPVRVEAGRVLVGL